MTLRTRLLVALLATSAVTLGAAALALLGPLQQRLDRESRDSVQAAARATRQSLGDALIDDRGLVGDHTKRVLVTLARRTSARVALYNDLPTPEGEVYANGVTDPDLNAVRRAVSLNKIQSTTTADGSGVAVPVDLRRLGDLSERRLDARIPWSSGNQFFVLVMLKPATGGEATDVVRGAFGKAALVGFGVAVLLGLILTATLSRRLGRLRRSALALARDGVAAPPPPPDDGRDEVGDLARALASMQKALRRQEEARRAFVATASHELRTPLTSLQGNLELLAEDLDSGDLDVDAAREQLRGARGQLQRLGNLAAELLDLSRLDAGVELRREPVELGELSRAVAAEFGLRAGDRAVDVDVVPPTGPVWAAGDPGAVARVARILIDNALRFEPPGGVVRVTAAYRGDRATLEVADHGPGVPLDERELIFERFQRGSRTGGAGGFGLGLAIGRELAHRQGGQLQLAGETDGDGARFVLSLPIELPRGSMPDDDETARTPSSTPGVSPRVA